MKFQAFNDRTLSYLRLIVVCFARVVRFGVEKFYSMASAIRDVEKWIISYFKLDERKTSISQEIRAGTATFLTMSYILLVNPQLLAKIGVSPTDIVVSTALSACIGSLIAGIYGNFPFGLASGVGLSAYLTYGLVLDEGLTVPEAFTSVS